MDAATFLNIFSKEIEDNNAAIFAGAGLSVSSGFVNWKELLKSIAEELGLDVDKEENLVSLAQYHCNEQSGNRSRLNQILINEFSQGHKTNINHEVLARLPIGTYWTTNYDRLIEKALENADKVVDTKYTVPQLAITKPKRDAIVYKMHGDIEHSDSAILTKDDYESYHIKYAPFVTALSGDLVSKTFLFIGFSFTDPNLDYILSRIRTTYTSNQRPHYCIMKEVDKKDGDAEGTLAYRKLKQSYFIKDLKRFNINTVLIKEYKEITEILQKLEARSRQKTVFVSGSAHEYGVWGEKKSLDFIQLLSKSLINSDLSIVSGFGLGVGSAVITGCMQEIYMGKRRTKKDQLSLRPFPQPSGSAPDMAALWDVYRRDMISYCGLGIFLFGNKIKDGVVVPADGIEKEFHISIELGLKLIPVGATGYMAKQLWDKVKADLKTFYPSKNADFEKWFEIIGDPSKEPQEIADGVLKIVSHLRKG